MFKKLSIPFISLMLLLSGSQLFAAVYGPSTSSTGNYTISWDPVSESPGRKEVLYYLVKEQYSGATFDLNNGVATSRSFTKSVPVSYTYTVIAYISNINPRTGDDTVSTSTLGTITVTVSLSPAVTASFNPTTISEGGSSTLSWSSSNTTSCSATGISGVSGTSGSRTYNAPSNMSSNQTQTITVTCIGSSGSASKSANVNINFINDTPTISAINNQTISENTDTGYITFSVSDEETPANSLSISKSSSNTALVTNSQILVSGSSNARTVKVTPVANKTGSSTITLIVSDGVKTQTETFTLTVNPVEGGATTISFVHTDLLGSPVAESNQAGEIK